MMSVRLPVAVGLALLALSSGASIAVAQCKQHGPCEQGFFEKFAEDYSERVMWPYPYVCPDREAARAPFAIMTQNGWRRQNMLSEEHFKDNGKELTDAGRLKVQWIMTGVPLPHRTIYVHRSDLPEVTEARIRTVQQLAGKTSPDGSVPTVLETSVSPGGWPAEKADAVNRKFHTALPVPELPKQQEASGSTGSK